MHRFKVVRAVAMSSSSSPSSSLITKITEASGRKLNILQTKYAFARFVLESITDKVERRHFQSIIKTEITPTLKYLTTHFQAESVLYNRINVKQRIAYFKSSALAAIDNGNWRDDLKVLDIKLAPSVWDVVGEIEIYNIPPLSLGKWTTIRARHDMSNTGYALPIYTLYGIDTLQTVLADFVSRFEIVEKSGTGDEDNNMYLHVENVQNTIFYKLTYGNSRSIILWLDVLNMPMPWKSNFPEKLKSVELLSRCYMMTRNIPYISEGIFNEPVVHKLIEHLISAPVHLYSADLPYDLYNFPNLTCIRDATMVFDCGEIWNQMLEFEEKNYILAQQMPRTFSRTALSVDTLLYWISKDKIPSNLLLRNINNSQRNYVRNSIIKLVYLLPQHKSTYLLNLTVKDRSPKLPNLGPLLPPILLAGKNFEDSVDCLQIMQNVSYLGMFNTIIFTDISIRPVSNVVVESEFVERMSAIQTIHIRQLDRIFQNHFNQDGYKYELIANTRNIKFVCITFTDLVCYAFVVDCNNEDKCQIQFNAYDLLFKILMENREKIFTNYRNLGIIISHLLDYYTALVGRDTTKK